MAATAFNKLCLLLSNKNRFSRPTMLRITFILDISTPLDRSPVPTFSANAGNNVARLKAKEAGEVDGSMSE